MKGVRIFLLVMAFSGALTPFQVTGALTPESRSPHKIVRVHLITRADDGVLVRYAESFTGSYNDEGLKMITLLVAESYHERGYLFSRADRALLKTDGTLEIYMADPVIDGIELLPHGSDPGEVKAYLKARLAGRVYNSYLVNRVLHEAGVRFRLKGVRARPLLVSADSITLSVERDPPEPWRLFFASDSLGPGGNSISGGAEYRPGDLGVFGQGALLYHEKTGYGYRTGGGGRFYFSQGLSVSAEASYSDLSERWSYRNTEYRKKIFYAGSVFMIRRSPSNLGLELFSENIRLTREYPGGRDITGGAGGIFWNYSDRPLLLTPEESLESGFKASVNIPESTGSIDAWVSKGFAPFHSWRAFTARPFLMVQATTSEDRFRMEYLHQGEIPGFRESFTAVRRKGGLSLKLQYEIIDSMFFIFAGSGALIYADDTGAEGRKASAWAGGQVRAGGFSLQAGGGSPFYGERAGAIVFLRFGGRVEF